METKIISITAGFLAGNLFEGTDPVHYANSLREHLERAYPGAEVEIPWQANTSGAIPQPLKTAVQTDDPMEPNHDLIQDVEGEILGHDREYWQL